MSDTVKTATFLGNVNPDAYGDQKLYRTEPPLEGNEHVVVSAVNAFGMGEETYIFPADSEGAVTNWLELDGSFRGSADHERALRNAGYEVTA